MTSTFAAPARPQDIVAWFDWLNDCGVARLWHGMSVVILNIFDLLLILFQRHQQRDKSDVPYTTRVCSQFVPGDIEGIALVITKEN